MIEGCIICANGNDLPEGEHCRACGREGKAFGLGAAVIRARGRQEPPSVPVQFDGPMDERLRADNQRLAAGLIEIINLPENWNAEGPIPYSAAMKIARAALSSQVGGEASPVSQKHREGSQ